MTLKIAGAFKKLTGAVKVITATVTTLLVTESNDTITTEAGVEIALDE
jgi:hypothetical protein